MKTMLPVLLLLFFSLTLTGQNTATYSFNDLGVPSAPGFQLLDASPASIERPVNPKQFAATMLNLTNNGSALPKNFALEFVPFWSYEKGTSLQSYLNIPDQEGSHLFSGIFKKMSVSMVSIYSDSTSGAMLKKTNYLSVGVKTNLLTYRGPKQVAAIKASLEAYKNRVNELKSNKDQIDALFVIKRNGLKLKSESKKLLEALDSTKINDSTYHYQERKTQLEATITQSDTMIADADAKLNDLYQKAPDDLEAKMKKDKIIQTCYAQIEEVPTVQVDAAFAYSDAVPDNDYSKKRFNRSGIWVNAALNTFSVDHDNPDDKLSIIGVVRYLSDNVLTDSATSTFERKNAVDYGYKVQYALKNISLGIEYLIREYANHSELDSKRMVGVLQYKITDGLFFTGSYGKNFGDVKNLFTLFGVNYGFGKSQLKLPDTP